MYALMSVLDPVPVGKFSFEERHGPPSRTLASVVAMHLGLPSGAAADLSAT